MLSENLTRIFNETINTPRVLDVGGAYAPLDTATHILDVIPFNERRPSQVGSIKPRYTQETWTTFDICDRPWPYPDKFFDYSFCSHTLEDIRDPVGVCHELMRVSRAGYIETPSRTREIFCHRGAVWLRRLFGRKDAVGFGHHRWFCEIDNNTVTFLAKTTTATASYNFFISRSELGRDLTPREATTFLFWNNSFNVRERLLIKPGETEDELTNFKTTTMARLKSATS